jgi:hypothetical protein
MLQELVCGALVSEPKAAARTDYQGRTEVSSPFCQLQFEQEPARYGEPRAGPPGSRGVS